MDNFYPFNDALSNDMIWEGIQEINTGASHSINKINDGIYHKCVSGVHMLPVSLSGNYNMASVCTIVKLY